MGDVAARRARGASRAARCGECGGRAARLAAAPRQPHCPPPPSLLARCRASGSAASRFLSCRRCCRAPRPAASPRPRACSGCCSRVRRRRARARGLRLLAANAAPGYVLCARTGCHRRASSRAAFCSPRRAGEVPTAAQAASVTADLHARARLPAHVAPLIRSLPKDMHPMTQLSMAVLAMQTESKFAKAYHSGAWRRRRRAGLRARCCSRRLALAVVCACAACGGPAPTPSPFPPALRARVCFVWPQASTRPSTGSRRTRT